METTFITIHDLSIDARVLYASDSIVDILGHTPDEVVGRPCWEFFHPEELPLAKEFHRKGVTLDKAAVLAYCQIRNRQGNWVGCECCFTIVYDVMVVCTSIYRRGLNSQRRAAEAPMVRRLFSSSPKDPRYHMLTHLSSKFKLGPQQQTHEPRAALFLNRFTRTLTIMYATSGIEQIMGISGEAMKGRSFYYCIQENCLEDAVRCLEGAKGNDSIAYLRFWFRDPRQDDPPPDSEDDTDETMTDVTGSDDEDEDVGATNENSSRTDRSRTPLASDAPRTPTGESSHHAATAADSTSAWSSAGTSRHEAILGQPGSRHNYSGNSNATSPASSSRSSENGPIELEAVVSCTSDGLVVCLRRARPLQPPVQVHRTDQAQQPPPFQPFQQAPHQPQQQPPFQQIPPQHQPFPQPQPAHAPLGFTTGLFAAPWAPNPVYLPPQPQLGPPLGSSPSRFQQQQPQQQPAAFLHGAAAVAATAPHAIGLAGPSVDADALSTSTGADGPAQAAFMQSIRDVAVFAWALTGINGSLEGYARGRPKGESQPPDGFPIWQPAEAGGGGTDETAPAPARDEAAAGAGAEAGAGDPAALLSESSGHDSGIGHESGSDSTPHPQSEASNHPSHHHHHDAGPDSANVAASTGSTTSSGSGTVGRANDPFGDPGLGP